MKNLEIYESLRTPPQEALKQIQGGRLKGMTDINPMWRIKALTERFGPAGIGWKYTIKDKHILEGANGEKAAFVDIDLYYKTSDGWSEAIPGTGGSMYVAKERNGMYTDDDCFKKALTDAISVSAKALGAGADIYWQKDRTKYSQYAEEPEAPQEDVPADAFPDTPNEGEYLSKAQRGEIIALCQKKWPQDMQGALFRITGYDNTEQILERDFSWVMERLNKAV